jgi:arginyl-tRNA synthetase
MNIFSIYQDHIEAAIERLAKAGKLPAGLDTSRLTAEPPRDPTHGDISTNAAMLLAKPAGMKPRDIAEIMAAELREVEGVGEVEIAGPGFINMRLGDSVWHVCLKMAIARGAA